MRWNKPKVDQTRIVTKFCIFPLTIDNTVYWLEKIRIVQRYTRFVYTSYYDVYDYKETEKFGWVNEKVLDENS